MEKQEYALAKKIAKLKNMGIAPSSLKLVLVERVWDRIEERLIPSSTEGTFLSGIFRTASPVYEAVLKIYHSP